MALWPGSRGGGLHLKDGGRRFAAVWKKPRDDQQQLFFGTVAKAVDASSGSGRPRATDVSASFIVRSIGAGREGPTLYTDSTSISLNFLDVFSEDQVDDVWHKLREHLAPRFADDLRQFMRQFEVSNPFALINRELAVEKHGRCRIEGVFAGPGIMTILDPSFRPTGCVANLVCRLESSRVAWSLSPRASDPRPANVTLVPFAA